MDHRQALIMCMIFAAKVNGKYERIEQIRIEGLVKYYPIFEGIVSHFDIEKENREFAKLLKNHKTQTSILNYLKKSLDEERLLRTAYAFSLEIISCDMHIDQDETNYLNLMAKVFELTPNATSKMEYSRKVRYLFD